VLRLAEFANFYARLKALRPRVAVTILITYDSYYHILAHGAQARCMYAALLFPRHSSLERLRYELLYWGVLI
jgi:hypothetical protein